MEIKKIYFPLIYTYYLFMAQNIYTKENLHFILLHQDIFSQDIINKYKILVKNTTYTLKVIQQNIFKDYIKNELPDNVSWYCWDIDLLNNQLIVKYK